MPRQSLVDLKNLVDELNKNKTDAEKIKSLMKKAGIRYSPDNMVCLARVMEKLTLTKSRGNENDLR